MPLSAFRDPVLQKIMTSPKKTCVLQRLTKKRGKGIKLTKFKTVAISGGKAEAGLEKGHRQGSSILNPKLDGSSDCPFYRYAL